MAKIVDLPLNEEKIQDLHSGENVWLTGEIYVARDAAHKRMIEALDKGQPLPFNIQDQIIYYMGPSPTRPGMVIGSAGPTTSSRMDVYSLRLIQAGLKGMIGKGKRSKAIREAMQQYHAVYFAAIGGAGALIARSIRKSEIIAYEELGAEAVRKLWVANFPVTVVNDIYGKDLYADGQARYRKVL